MLNNNHQEMLKVFGEALGLTLEFDDNGNCDLLYDDSIPVTFRNNEDDGIITIFAPLLNELPDPLDYSAVQTLLSLSLLPCLSAGGNAPVVGFDEESGFVVLYEVCTASELQAKGLLEIFTEFIGSYLSLKDYLAGTDENAESDESDEDKEDPANLPENGLLI